MTTETYLIDRCWEVIHDILEDSLLWKQARSVIIQIPMVHKSKVNDVHNVFQSRVKGLKHINTLRLMFDVETNC